mmetsp:Transcript_30520/g.65489  ORF Transcript_30520/g.65489 Transcript_30520/m.65489 type:complete len:82 (+) Transcript_30520:2-247(+)
MMMMQNNNSSNNNNININNTTATKQQNQTNTNNRKNNKMHTVWVRLNAVVFFGLTVLLGLSCLASFSKIGHTYMHQPGKGR